MGAFAVDRSAAMLGPAIRQEAGPGYGGPDGQAVSIRPLTTHGGIHP